MTPSWYAVAGSALLACASSPSTAPHAMSAAEHEAAARRAGASAAEHDASYDSRAWQERGCPLLGTAG